MKISKKALFTVSVIVAVYAVAGFILLRGFVAPQFSELESANARNDLARAVNMISREILSVDAYSSDYARWDDTYRYLQTPENSYIESNYSFDSMKTQNMDLICIVDLKGRIVFSRVYAPDGSAVALDDFERNDSPLSRLLSLGVSDSASVLKGFILTSRGLLIVSSCPVVDSRISLPTRGRLVAGRFFDDTEQKKLCDIIKADLAFPVPAESSGVTFQDSSITNDRNRNQLVLTHVIRDVFGSPAAVMTLHYPTTVSDKGNSVVNISMLILLGCGLIVLASILLYLRRVIIAPLAYLDERATEIASSVDFLGRLPAERRDEIGELAHSFNTILDALASVNVSLEQRVKHRTRELEESTRNLVLLGRVFENSIEGIYITDSYGIILRVNPAFTKITGYQSDEVVGKKATMMRSARHDDAFFTRVRDCIVAEGKWAGEVWAKNRAGRVYPQWSSFSSIRNEDGSMENIICVFHDISDAKQQESYIKYQAYHDTLTGLPNRVLLLERMSGAIERGNASSKRFALLFLDLDHFKNINDSLGHDYGDVLLQHVAERLEKLTRDSDTVARLGGDEFIIMAEDVDDANQPGMLAERIIDSFKNPFIVRDQIFHIGTSIGIAVFPEDGEECSTLMRNADTAMYRAKEEGRLRYCHFTTSLNERIANQIRLENDLRMAVEANEFEVWYQPKVSFETGETEGFEALVRWNNGGVIISPMEFIPLAEQTGLILPIDRIVMKRAFVDIRDLNAGRQRPLRVAVNASAKALQHRLFPDEVMMLMKQIGVDPSWIEIEITETEIMKDLDACLDVINRLSGVGISIALDDFGTGYSSLSQLSRIPVKTLKIDRSFVMTIDNGKNETSIIDNINALAKGLHLKVVAEGVETVAQRDYLRNIGCDLMQGYFVSKPLPLPLLRDFLREADFNVHR